MSNSNSTGKQDEVPQVIVIGTSAGGLHALRKLGSQLMEDFPVPILVVQHVAANASGDIILKQLSKLSKLTCKFAESGDSLKPGHLYLGPSDHHMMIQEDRKIIITKGAHENRYRPAIDPLFRSAAVAFGSGVTGIILTGYLDDGTAGMKVIKTCGGVCIVQDPMDADYPFMPQNVLNNVEVDHCVPLAEMGSLLYQVIGKERGKSKKVSHSILTETKIATRVLSDLSSVNELGDQVPFNCPGCGGVLWKVDSGDDARFRCHTGHAYTANALLTAQSEKIEETMWTALRMFEERKNLLTTIAKEKKGSIAESARQRAELSQVHIDRIRKILMSDDKG